MPVERNPCVCSAIQDVIYIYAEILGKGEGVRVNGQTFSGTYHQTKRMCRKCGVVYTCIGLKPEDRPTGRITRPKR